MPEPKNKKASFNTDKRELREEIYRILALYEDKRGVPPAHYLALMVLGDVGCVDVEENPEGTRLIGQVTPIGRLIINQRRKGGNMLTQGPSPH